MLNHPHEYLFRGKSTGDLAPWITGYYHYHETLRMHFICDQKSLQRHQVQFETIGRCAFMVAGQLLFEHDWIRIDSTKIGGTVTEGYILWNNDNTLDGLCFGLWTINGWHKTDFLGEIKLLDNVIDNPELKKHN